MRNKNDKELSWGLMVGQWYSRKWNEGWLYTKFIFVSTMQYSLYLRENVALSIKNSLRLHQLLCWLNQYTKDLQICLPGIKKLAYVTLFTVMFSFYTNIFPGLKNKSTKCSSGKK